MERVGTEDSGFTVAVDAAARTVLIEAWGFWSVAVCSAFGKTVVDVCRKAVSVRRLELDAIKLKPLREEGETAWALVLATLPRGVEAFVVKTNSLTKLQLLRIARASSDRNLVQFP